MPVKMSISLNIKTCRTNKKSIKYTFRTGGGSDEASDWATFPAMSGDANGGATSGWKSSRAATFPRDEMVGTIRGADETDCWSLLLVVEILDACKGIGAGAGLVENDGFHSTALTFSLLMVSSLFQES
jgi:hypothetical protein